MRAIRTISSAQKEGLVTNPAWDLAVIGVSVDNRGEEAIAYATKSAAKVIKLVYDTENGGQFLVDGQVVAPSLFREELAGKRSILIESTTLGVVEILHLLRHLENLRKETVDILYVEPMEYAQTPENGVLTSREYNLGGNRRFAGVRNFILDLTMHDQGNIIFFLGYEGARLAQALEQLPIQGWRKFGVFGIPSYAPGWETNAFANNVEHIYSSKFSAVKFCSASGVLDAYQMLHELHGKNLDTDKPTVVVPIGTKPHSIAAALFLCDLSAFQETGLVFDHAARKSWRSRKVRKWHLYQISGREPVVS